MRRKSHIAMGHFLAKTYLPRLPRRYIRLFLFGCIEPDENPTTYLKGSLRSQWMRGHNYGNSQRFLFRLAARLERRKSFSAWDYYSLGKLIHYTMDAFTYPHNDHFCEKLIEHRIHEVRLQHHFLTQLKTCKPQAAPSGYSAVGLILQAHKEYLTHPGAVDTDTDYAIRTCCALMEKLTENVAICQKR